MSSYPRIINRIIFYIQKHHLITLGVFVGIAVLIGSIAFPLLQSPRLHIAFLDVGQGDAIWIQAPNGRELLIDSGPDQSVLESIGKEKNFFDNTIDIILATHSDKDHIGGFPYLFDRYQIPLVIESEISSPTITDKTFTERITTEGADRLLVRAGERILLDPRYGIVVDMLFPDQNTTGWETNEASVIVKVTYGSTSFLLTGDSPSEVEQFLVKTYGAQLQSDVLKLGHHGSKTSSSSEFLETVKPSFAIVSAGLGNKYGHPHEEVIERVEEVRAQILETSQLGTIDCYSDGKTAYCTGSK
jgi:competence protein ComEC